MQKTQQRQKEELTETGANKSSSFQRYFANSSAMHSLFSGLKEKAAQAAQKETQTNLTKETPTVIEHTSNQTKNSSSQKTTAPSRPNTKPGNTSILATILASTLAIFGGITAGVFRFLTNKFVLGFSAVMLVSVAFAITYLLKDLPSPQNLASGENFAVSTQIFDRNGELLYEIFGDENRIPITLEELPEHVLQATISIEDQRFYSHHGFDLVGIFRAIRNNLRGQSVEGGSTITQQLVKNALLTPERSLDRKVKEAVLAVLTELMYSKKEILEMYLNYISYGGTAVGIESAAQRYFGISARELTVAQAALLAGLPQAPSRYSPFGSNPQAAKNRQADVINAMVRDGYLTKAQAEEAKAEALYFALSTTDIKAPHFVFYVRDLLYEQFGVERVEKGGLRVTTTLDLKLQNAAQASVSAEIATLNRHNVSNGAALVTKPNTGEILAMVGSKNYFDSENDGQVNVTIAQRQPGSSIKPLVYATAFQDDTLNPGTVLLDIPTCFEIANQTDYCPRNYDGGFRGPVTVRESLGNSYNIPAVKSILTIGVDRFIQQANAMGITTWKDPSRYGPSLALGAGEVKMIDLAQAFGVLANQGVKVPLSPILKIEDYRGNELFNLNIEKRLADLAELSEFEGTTAGELTRVMDRAPAYLVSHIMQDNKARSAAFGPRSKLVIPNQIVSAKTGTTNDLKDNWTVGFTPEFLTITWVGNNDNTPMNRFIVSGVTGAAPIFNDIMSYILQDREPVWQEKPADVSSAGVCATGFPPQPGDNCQVRYTELFWELSKPSKAGTVVREVWVNRDTGLPHRAGESEDNLELRTHTFFEDPTTEPFCLDCAKSVNEDGTVRYQPQRVRVNRL
jgi:1A family penicillin-binding protein